MKKLTLLVLLIMMTPGLGGEGVVFLNQAAAAGAPGEAVGARSEYATEHQIKAPGEKNPRIKKNLRSAEPTNEVEAKRLKLIFLLLMSQGQTLR